MSEQIEVYKGHGSMMTPQAGIDKALAKLGEIQRLGETLHRSKIFTNIKTVEQMTAIVLKAVELEIPATEAAGGLYVVNGKIACMGQLMLALIYRAGGIISIKESDGICQVSMSRPGQEAYTASFSINEAKVAGLDGFGWKKYPKDMIRWRAIARAARTVFPDAIGGMYLPDEMEVPMDAEGNVVEVAAEAVPVEAVSEPLPEMIQEQLDKSAPPTVEETEQEASDRHRKRFFAILREHEMDSPVHNETWPRERFTVQSRSELTAAQWQELADLAKVHCEFHQRLSSQLLLSFRASLLSYLRSHIDEGNVVSFYRLTAEQYGVANKTLSHYLTAGGEALLVWQKKVLEWHESKHNAETMSALLNARIEKLTVSCLHGVEVMGQAIAEEQREFGKDQEWTVRLQLLLWNHLMRSDVEAKLLARAEEMVKEMREVAESEKALEETAQEVAEEVVAAEVIEGNELPF